jgi:hypothetical protein
MVPPVTADGEEPRSVLRYRQFTASIVATSGGLPLLGIDPVQDHVDVRGSAPASDETLFDEARYADQCVRSSERPFA